jgi:hypothetical protein
MVSNLFRFAQRPTNWCELALDLPILVTCNLWGA